MRSIETPQTQAPQPEPTLTMLFRAAIGPINTDLYLPIFNRFEASGHVGLSWNWAASLCTMNWLVFRGLWGAALSYLGLLVFLPPFIVVLGRLVLDWPEPVEATIGLIGLVLLFVLPGVGANAYFYQVTRKNMVAALAASANLEQACGLLVVQSSSRQRFIRILVTNAALLCLLAPLCVLFFTRYSSVHAYDAAAPLPPVLAVSAAAPPRIWASADPGAEPAARRP